MTDTRKGILTPEQESKLDDLVKFNSVLAESIDGLAIQLIDNQGIEKLKAQLIEKYPGALEIVYAIVDALFEGIGQITQKD